MALKNLYVTNILPSYFSSRETWKHWFEQELKGTIIMPLMWEYNEKILSNEFLINTAPVNVYFILHYRLFFRKGFFFECLYFSEYDIWMFLFVFSLRNRPPIKHVRNWRNGGGGGGSHPKSLQVRTGGWVWKIGHKIYTY